MREPPFTFGDYEVTEVIAQGGMGVVYRARQRSPNRWVALKMIRSGDLASPEELQRFRTEAEAAATLDHPGIVPIYEVGDIDGQPYFSMRLVEGGSLEAHKQETIGDARRVAALIERVARAVHHAHLRGILHRDLKPGNVLLEEGDRPVVTDFGLARRLDAASTRYTLTGMVLGTPAYMAPEQARGDPRAVTTAADVWSLGVLLYELVTGQLPFQGTSMMDLLGRVIADEPTPPSRVLPRIPLDLGTICLKCLRKEPRDRYASAAELADDLARFLRGDPVAARPLSTIERAVRWTRRHPVTGATAVFLIVALVGGLAALTAYFRSQAETERRARARAYLALGTKSAEADAPLLAGLYFAAAERLVPSPIARSGLRAHRAPIPLRALNLGSGTIWRIVFEPDGRRAAIGTDGGVWIWDPDEAHAARLPIEAAQGDEIHGLAFDGSRLATGDKWGQVALWAVPSGKQIRACPEQPRDDISSVAFADGGRLVAFAGPDGTFSLWDIDRGSVARIPFEPFGEAEDVSVIRVRYVRADPTGTRVLVAARVETKGATRGQARLWDTGSARFLDGGAEFEGEPWCADFSEDGTRVAVCGDLGVCVWEGARGDETTFLPGLRPMGAVAFGPEGTVLVGDTSGMVVRLDPDTRFEVGRPLLPLFATYAVAASPDGKRVLTGGRDGILRSWTMPDGEPQARVLRGTAEMAALDADENRLFAVASESALLGKCPVCGRPIPLPGGAAGRRFVLADLDTGRVTQGEPVERDPAALAPSGDGWWLVTATPDGGRWIEVRTTPEGRPEARMLASLPDKDEWRSLEIVPGDGVYLRSVVGALRRLRADGREDAVAEGLHGFDVTADGSVLALLDLSPAVRVRMGGLRGRDGTSWPVPPGTASVAADPRGRRFATKHQVAHGDSAGALYLFDAATGRQVGPGMVNVDIARFRPDGLFLVTGAKRDGWIRFLDAESGEMVGRVLRHFGRNGNAPVPAPFRHVAFSPSGRKLVVVCGDGAIHVWDLGWLDDRALHAEAEWERAQLAAMRTLDDEGVERQIPVEEWQERRDRWLREHGE